MAFRMTVLGTDVEIDAPAGTPLSAVRGLCEEFTGPWPDDWEQAWAVGGNPLSSAVLGFAPLLAGAVLPPPDEASAEVPGGLAVEVVAGPSAGDRLLLAPGRHVVGRPEEAAFGLDDPSVSRRHAELRIDRDGSITVRDLGSLNGTALLRTNDREAVRGWVEVRPGTDLAVGSSVLRFTPTPVRPAALTPDGAGHLLLNRPPRLLTDPAPHQLRWPSPERPLDPPAFPVLALVVPLAVAGVLALVWTPLSLLLGLASPVLVGGQWWSGRRRHRIQTRRRAEEFDRACQDVRGRHRRALDDEHARAHDRCPDAATLLAEVVHRGDRVFGRSPTDPDHLLVRVGLGDVAATSSTVRGTGASADEGGDGEVPAAVLHDAPVTLSLAQGPVGVCGDRARVLGCTRFLLAQLAGWESPGHLRVLVGDGPAGSREQDDWAGWLPHTDRAPEGDVLQAAVAEVRRRRAGAPDPALLVVLDHVADHRRDPRLAELLGRGPALGVHVLCRAGRLGELPTECRTVVDLQAAPALVRTAGGVQAVRPDLVEARWALRFARALAPLRDAGAGTAGSLPAEVALADLLPPCTAESLRRAWSRPPRGLPAVLGADGTGPCTLDLVADGPHTLVAGTTGSGKSVLLATLVTSLAVAVGPRDLQFVLVDYKGGAAFGECARLPHVAGLVTDLDEHLAARVLRSLRAEVARRERVLARARVADAGDLPAGALPRLVVVVDEFRVLSQEVPEFVDGLVRLASVGRSLGVHLVLATQRPAGVVSPEIRANTDVRIALRVTDRADAEDVVGDARPAGFTAPGRALLRCSGSGPREFQTASTRSRPAALAVRVPGERSGAGLVDDLPRILAAAREAAEGLPLPPAPWLPPLPATVAATDVPAVLDGTVPDGTALEKTVLGWGVLDLPDAQRRGTAGFDLSAGHHLLVVGGVRSGRTTLLRRLVVAAGGVPGLSVHVLDAGGGLADLAGTGATGSVVTREEVWRAGRLLERLQEEVDRRRARRLSAATEGYVLLVVDGWEAWTAALTAADPAVGADGLLRLLREASGVGVRVVVAGDRQSLTGAVAASAGAVVLLRVADRTDGALLGVRPADVPRDAVPGRGLLVVDGTAREVQVALPAAPGGPGAPRVPGVAPLPGVLGPAPWSGPGLALGRGGDDGGVVAVEVHPVLLVCGPSGSGRTTALRTLAAAHEAGGGTVCWVRGTAPDGVRRAVAAGALLLVDDVGRALAPGLEEVVVGAVDAAPLVVAGEGGEVVGAFRGLAALVRTRARTTVLLGRERRVPAEVVGRRSVASPGPGPGAGFVVREGRWTSVRVADPAAVGRPGRPTVSG